MADTFFGFNTTLNDDRLGSSPEDIEGLEAEEEYDALNDETFGALDNELGDDWEAEHEQLAEIEESNRNSISESIDQNIESFLDHIGLNDEEENLEKRDKSVWSYNYLTDAIKSLSNILQNEIRRPQSQTTNLQQIPQLFHQPPQPRLPSPQQVPKVRTVEELERMLLNQSKPTSNNVHLQNSFPQQPPSGQLQIPHPRFPPGFPPIIHGPPHSGSHGPPQPHGHGPPPGWPHFPHGPPHGLSHGPQYGPPHGPPHGPHPGPLHGPAHGPPYGPGSHGPPGPPGLVRLMGNAVPPHQRVPPHPHMMGPPPPPPGFPLYGHHNSGFPMNHPFNFPPPPRIQQNVNNQQHPQQQQQQQRSNNFNNQQQQQQQQNRQQRDYNRNKNRERTDSIGDRRDDDYAGLMVSREKQWLLNLQMLQVNTGTPYFDDYYYTVFKERQSKTHKENQNGNSIDQKRHSNNRFNRDGNAGHHREKNQEKNQENQLIKQKLYTPLQFENSLGKLQSASVTAPRKIIDMDIIHLDKDSDGPQATRDSRKTKQLLLELEVLYSIMLKAEDLKNPMAINNTEKLKELKQKQRLREIEAAPTAEQKQEILKLLTDESLAEPDNQEELLNKIINALLQDDKLSSFIGIRKGKMLLLRLLPLLSSDAYSSQLLEIWTKILLSIPLIGRRDTIGDNILPKFYPLLKNYIGTCNMDKILDIVSSLKETIKLEHSNRSTPLSITSKMPLHFIVSNKFGISSLALIIVRVEDLAEALIDKQLIDWCSFMTSTCEVISSVSASVPIPIQSIASDLLKKHTNRLNTLSQDKISLIEKTFVDSDR